MHAMQLVLSLFWTLTPSGHNTPGGVELAYYIKPWPSKVGFFAGTNFHRHRAGIEPRTPRTTVS